MSGAAAKGADPAGRDAPNPWAMPGEGWWAVLKRSYAEISDDNVGLIAAGIAFYGFASIVPILAATVLTYGLVADRDTVVRSIQGLFSTLPADAARLIQQQLLTVVGTSGGKKGFGLVVALAIALYGGTKASGSVVTGLNIAYEVKETRSFLRTSAISLAVVVGAVALILTAVATTGALAFLDGLIPGAPGFVLAAIRVAAYLVLGAVTVTAVACLFRYAPNRADAKWAWLTPGSAAATALWLAGTAAFGFYVSRFGNYGATYGSLGAVVVLLTWLWLSAYVLLLGAELNCELERQTDAATTEDGSKPGERAEGGPGSGPGPARRPRARVPADGGPGVAGAAAGVSGAARAAGRKAGLAPALLAGAGLSTLRRGRAGGAAMVALGAMLAWLGRERRG